MVFLNSKVIKKKRICKKKKKNILKKEIVCVRLTTSLLTPGIQCSLKEFQLAAIAKMSYSKENVYTQKIIKLIKVLGNNHKRKEQIARLKNKMNLEIMHIYDKIYRIMKSEP